MVYTRQMTIGNNGSTDSIQLNIESPVKSTRNSPPAVISGCSSTMQYCKALTPSVQSINILDLPPEVLEKVFSYLAFKNICQLRLVSKSNFFLNSILNSSKFSNASVKLMILDGEP